MLDFAWDTSAQFRDEESLREKKKILLKLGSNLLLKDKIVSIDTDSALLPMILVSNPSTKNSGTFEPPNGGSNKEKSRAFNSANPIWLRGQGSNL